MVENSGRRSPGGSLLVIGPGGSVVLGTPVARVSPWPVAPKTAVRGPLQAAVAACRPRRPWSPRRWIVCWPPNLWFLRHPTRWPPPSSAAHPCCCRPATYRLPRSPHSSSFILSPSSLVLPASPVPHSEVAVDRTGGQPAEDARPRVAALRTAGIQRAQTRSCSALLEALRGKRPSAGRQSASRHGVLRPGSPGVDLRPRPPRSGREAGWIPGGRGQRGRSLRNPTIIVCAGR